MTYVPTWSGWVYVAFVTDWGRLPLAGDYARRVLGWSVAVSMSTQLVLNAIEQAIWTRGRAGRDDLSRVEPELVGSSHERPDRRHEVAVRRAGQLWVEDVEDVAHWKRPTLVAGRELKIGSRNKRSAIPAACDENRVSISK